MILLFSWQKGCAAFRWRKIYKYRKYKRRFEKQLQRKVEFLPNGYHKIQHWKQEKKPALISLEKQRFWAV